MHRLINKYLPSTLYRRVIVNSASFSQVGEDRIILYFFRSMLEKKSITYIDIGANDPVQINNTYLLYLYYDNKKGVIVDADPECVKKMRKKRKKDICLNYGISSEIEKKRLLLYRFYSNTLNTFSEKEAELFKKKGYRLKDTIEVPLISINELHDKYFGNNEDVDFLSIDIEGMDIDVLMSIDYNRWKPTVICMESAEFQGRKRLEFEKLKDFFAIKGYEVLADTWINTIFVQSSSITEYVNK